MADAALWLGYAGKNAVWKGAWLVSGREQLYASTFWGIRRPQFPLTPGHFVIRLTDPSLAFDLESATDLLHCYRHVRLAMAALKGATAAQLYISRNWSPVGDAMGEPVAETSTPTLHVFISWPGSPAASAALRLPAHLRQPVADCAALDESLRQWNTGAKPSGPATPGTPQTGPARPEASRGSSPWQSQAFVVEPAPAKAAELFRVGHWTAVPREPVASLDVIDPTALLELAAGVEQLAWHSSPRHAGMTVWASDVWGEHTAIDIFGRQHGQGIEQVATFAAAGGLELPTRQRRHANFNAPSPTVEK